MLIYLVYFDIKYFPMTLNGATNSKYLWQFVIILSLLVYVVGMLVPILELDGAMYAEISREMYRNGNYLELFHKGQDWLDKPHFQFWITAVSFKLFGINSFAFKLPAILFMLTGVYYTYLFGKKFYGEKQGYLAALLLMTSQHIITSNSDVRAEPYLTGLTIFSLYYLAVYLKEKKFNQLLISSFGLACLLMSKGLFTIIPVASGLGLALIYERKWREIIHWQWVVMGILTLFFISPVLYGYYIQFDSHPEKLIFGQHNVSGIKFFFWDSQWGRFTNTGPIKGIGDPLFFLHTMLWAYLPWAFLAYFALIIKGKSLIKQTNKKETYTFFGFIFLFIIFSLSSFQLPHYLNALFPFLSILSADALIGFARNRKFLNAFYHIHIWSSAILVAGIILLNFVFSNQYPSVDIFVVFIIGIALIVLVLRAKRGRLKKLIFVPAITVLLANYYINRSFYPQLLTYQSESEVAYYMKKNQLKEEELVSFALDTNENMTSFLQDRIVPTFDTDFVKKDDLKNKYVFTNQKGIDHIITMDLKYELRQTFLDFPITTLNGTFINKNTRKLETKTRFLVKIIN